MQPFECKVFIAGHEVMPFDENVSIEIRRKPVDKKEIENLIREKTAAAEAYMESVKDEVAELADKAGVQAYWGEYGSGETYYPVGTDVNAEYIGWEASEYADENGILTQGVWISSSSMC
jgi:hypothetical protein